MAREKLAREDIDAWIANHPGWAVVDGALAKRFDFPDFGSALGFVVRLGCAAERRDHHPDVQLGWGKTEVRWSTHDAGGITQVDLTMAELTESMAR